MGVVTCVKTAVSWGLFNVFFCDLLTVSSSLQACSCPYWDSCCSVAGRSSSPPLPRPLPVSTWACSSSLSCGYCPLSTPSWHETLEINVSLFRVYSEFAALRFIQTVRGISYSGMYSSGRISCSAISITDSYHDSHCRLKIHLLL